MDLATVWFVIIAFFWLGYLVLEGFDFGVGMLVGVLGGRGTPAEVDRRRRAVLTTIGPHWDGNEVWLIVAGGATFAAFPDWYATMFSGFYLPLLLVLVALILRAVALEYRGKRREVWWRRRWDLVIMVGSAVPAVVWGVALGHVVHGVPIDAAKEYVGGLSTMLSPFPLLLGVTTLALFLTHGAVFLALRTDGGLRRRARGIAGRVGPVTLVLAAGSLVWLGIDTDRVATWVLAAIAALALVAALLANGLGREGWAFTGTTITTAAVVAALFVSLFPAVMPSTLDPAWSLTIANASSSPYTLRVMTIAALVSTPVVLAYQAWTYWVFRRRVRVEQLVDDLGTGMSR